MIRIESTDLPRDTWNSTAASMQDFSLLQTWEYGQEKQEQGSWRAVRLSFIEDGRVIGLCQCMTRKLPLINRGVVWANRGPLWRTHTPGDVSQLVEMLAELRNYWVTERGMYLLVAPPVAEQEIGIETLRAHGFARAPKPSQWVSSRVDLDESLEQLRKNLEHKWRNCLSKAERSGLRCESGSDPSLLSYVLSEYSEMLTRKNLTGSASPELLVGLHARFGLGNALRSFVAVKDDERLGGILIAKYGSTCEYLVGAVSQKGKGLNAGNYLLWQAVAQMKELGCRWLDLGGMHPVKTSKGILHFKRGLGGQGYALLGNIEAYQDNALNKLIGWYVNRGH